MLHFLIDVIGVIVGIGLWHCIKWLIRRDINQSQVGGKGSVNVQVGGSIKGDATGELDYGTIFRPRDPSGRDRYY